MIKRFLSCAKINLDLRVHAKNNNGLHEISSSMQFIDLSDEITIDLSNTSSYKLLVDGNIDCSSESNLITKAHFALEEAKNQKIPCTIHLKKIIPLQSGLGGGSSNAATVLLALNSLLKLNLTQNELMTIGHSLGSDVPFFIRGESGVISGTGELFKPRKFEIKDYSLLIPDVKSSTKELFSEFDKTKHLFVNLNKTNDFELIFFEKFSRIKSQLEDLNIMHPIYLSGTGSALFFEDNNFIKLSKIEEKIPPNWRSFKCKALQYSPNYELWGVAKR